MWKYNLSLITGSTQPTVFFLKLAHQLVKKVYLETCKLITFSNQRYITIVAHQGGFYSNLKDTSYFKFPFKFHYIPGTAVNHCNWLEI